jgi:ketosteroid isomerase-like protein
MLLLQVPRHVGADATSTTQDTLLDRILIEDLMVDYYTVLTLVEDRHDIGSYFTKDAVLEVNGTVIEGRDAIQKLYDTGRDPRVLPGNTHNMLLNNPRISVDGDTATMDAIWTGVLSNSVTSTPRVLEQGTEHTELVKQDGRWLITKRVIVTQGGLPETWAGN